MNIQEYPLHDLSCHYFLDFLCVSCHECVCAFTTDTTFLMGYLIQLIPSPNCSSSVLNLESEIPYVSLSTVL